MTSQSQGISEPPVLCHVFISLAKIEAVKHAYPELKQQTASGVIENLVQKALEDQRRQKPSAELPVPEKPVSK